MRSNEREHRGGAYSDHVDHFSRNQLPSSLGIRELRLNSDLYSFLDSQPLIR